MNVAFSDITRSEVRQFLVALSALAFLLATLGLRDGGATAFAADIVLVLCGGWCANQLIRGIDVLKEQVICVMQAYFVGLLCCSTVLFVVGWMVFLPSEFLNLGNSLLFAATFTTNFQVALLPGDDAMRFYGLLDHLWVPALIAQCCVVLTVLYWLMHRNTIRLLSTLSVLFVVSLSVSTSDSPIVQMLPIGGLWAFLGGAIPFLAAHRFPVLRYALLLGIITCVTGILCTVAYGDTLMSRTFLAISFAFFYVGSRPRVLQDGKTEQRRRWFGIALHVFLWALPLIQVTTALDINPGGASNLLSIILPTILLALASWSVWQFVESRVHISRVTPTGVIALLLLANGIATLSSEGLQIRFDQNANAYIHALESKRSLTTCPTRAEGTLSGLAVCEIGPPGAPSVLIWGDHQLMAMRAGFEEAADRAGVSGIMIAQPDCVPLDGLQTRFSETRGSSGRGCDQHSAQVMQSLSHLSSVKQVTIVGDWHFYTGGEQSDFGKRGPIRLGPIDGTPIDLSMQADYVATAATETVVQLVESGLRVSVIRQVPMQPHFDAEVAARAEAPGSWLYSDMPHLSIDVSKEEAIARHAPVDRMFRDLSTKGLLHYVDTWPRLCSASLCSARGGLSSDYMNATQLTPSGARALAPILEKDMLRSRTHVPYRSGTGS